VAEHRSPSQITRASSWATAVLRIEIHDERPIRVADAVVCPTT
jgi:hypothetical protein